MNDGDLKSSARIRGGSRQCGRRESSRGDLSERITQNSAGSGEGMNAGRVGCHHHCSGIGGSDTDDTGIANDAGCGRCRRDSSAGSSNDRSDIREVSGVTDSDGG